MSQVHSLAPAGAVDESFDPLNDFSQFTSDPKDNAGLVATFYKRAEANMFRSAEERRPVFDEKIFILIERVGDKLSTNDLEATDYHKARFRAEYEAFQRGDGSQLMGIPIETLPGLSVSRVAELKACKIHTIQGLASVPDSAGRHVGMDFARLRDQARTFLEALGEHQQEQAVAEVKQMHHVAQNATEQRFQELEGAIGGISGMLQQLLAGQANSINAGPQASPAPIAAPVPLRDLTPPPPPASDTPPATENSKDIV